jgi:hypothetical protein
MVWKRNEDLVSEPIQCFMLTEVEYVTLKLRDARTQIYAALNGKRYHIGLTPIETESGEKIDPAPPGAMWNAHWFRECRHESGLYYDRNPDGIVLCVRTPGGDWIVDGPSFRDKKESGSWTRTGTIPNVTVTPSILQPNYHGWLRNGQLVRC